MQKKNCFTTNCIRGGGVHGTPNFGFRLCNFNATKFWAEYFCNCLNIGYADFREKKMRSAMSFFPLISRKLALLRNVTMSWPPFCNIIIFSNFIPKMSMYSCSAILSLILLKNSFGKVFFFSSNFGHVTICFLASILKLYRVFIYTFIFCWNMVIISLCI